MIAKLSEKIANNLIKSETIIIEDKEIYAYGLEQGFYMCLNFMTSIIIGLIFNMLIESLVFMVAYLPLRSYAGGYHAKTQVKCYFTSVLAFVMALLLVKFVPWTTLTCAIVIACASVIIFIFAPVEDQNKPLDMLEVKVYKKRAYIILSMLVVASSLLLWFSELKIASSVAIALTLLAVALVIGKLKNNIKL